MIVCEAQSGGRGPLCPLCTRPRPRRRNGGPRRLSHRRSERGGLEPPGLGPHLLHLEEALDVGAKHACKHLFESNGSYESPNTANNIENGDGKRALNAVPCLRSYLVQQQLKRGCDECLRFFLFLLAARTRSRKAAAASPSRRLKKSCRSFTSCESEK